MMTIFGALRVLLFGGLVGGLGLGAFALVDTAPRVPAPVPPLAEDASYAHGLFRKVQEIRYAPGLQGELSGNIDEINGLFRLLARAHPELSGRARLEGDRLVLDMSVAVPRTNGAGWLNLSAVVAPYDARDRGDGFAFESLRVGGITVPSRAGTAGLRWALDRRLGDGAGTKMMAALSRMQVTGEQVVLAVDLSGLPRGNLSRVTVGDVYGRSMPTLTEVAANVAEFEAAAAEGRLPVEGSFLPWLRHLLEVAGTQAGDDPERALIAGLVALNYLCGSVHFVPMLLPRVGEGEERLAPPGQACQALTLHDRIDLRRHFLTAATIKAISDRNPAVVAGEAKELVDMVHGHFDFTDIAANNSGIRLATLMLATPPARWPDLAAAMGAEADVIIPLDGIPGEIRREVFEERFGAVDSPAYTAMMAEIEARIDALPIHRAAPGGG